VAPSDSALMAARAAVLHDLEVTCGADAHLVSLLEDAVETRRWWVEQWPQGRAFAAGLVAQDVQDALLDEIGRWPLCHACADEEPHALYIQPEIGGPDPVWFCEVSGVPIAPLGSLGP
jgi:hypothetical protein